MLNYKYNTLRLAFLLATIMLIAPCCKQKSNPTTQQIELVKRQVSADREALHEIESDDYPQLEDDFYHCDSMLQYVDQETAVQQFDKLNLAKAYLIQFQETCLTERFNPVFPDFPVHHFLPLLFTPAKNCRRGCVPFRSPRFY